MYLGIMTGTIAFVYAVLLTEPGHIFFGFKNWLSKILIRRIKVRVELPDAVSDVFKEQYKIVEKETIFWKPIIGCERCVSGQLALWTYVFTVRPFVVIDFLFCMALSILLTTALSIIYKWTQQENL